MSDGQRPAAPVGAFGFEPAESEAHFVVFIPAGNRLNVAIRESFAYRPQAEETQAHAETGGLGQPRAELPRLKWDAIAEPARAEFNRRLKGRGRRAGRWKTGPNYVSRFLGKELTLLAWAIEDADPALIPAAVANWVGLAPEERWWLYTMTAAATGDCIHGRNRGWRKAVRYALTENPAGGLHQRPVVPEFFRLARERAAAGRDE